MAKISQEIKPEAVERLKTILREQNISQRSLANLAGLSQNTISKIMNGKSPLTYTVASLISEKFPEYRPEWIMAIDDDRTEEMHTLRPYGERILRNQAKRDAIKQLFLYMNLECVLDVHDVYGSDIPLSKLSEEEQNEILGELIPEAAENNFALKICDVDGNVLARLSSEEFQSLTNEIADYFEFKVNKLCHK